MTVLLPTPFEHDDSDLAKSLGLLDSCDVFEPFTEEDLRLGDDMLSFDTDFLSLPAAFAPALPVAAMAASPVAAQVPKVEPSSMVPLAELHSKPSMSPASSDSWHPTGSSEMSSDGISGTPAPDSGKKDPRIGKRKPCPDLESIPDIQERRKQRRLAKNRATAAVSRERKRAQMSTLQTRVQQLESDNANLHFLLTSRDAELAAMRQRLAAAGVAQ